MLPISISHIRLYGTARPKVGGKCRLIEWPTRLAKNIYPKEHDISDKRSHEDTRISLHPLSVEDALRVMVETPPPPAREDAKEKARKKRAGKEESGSQ